MTARQPRLHLKPLIATVVVAAFSIRELVFLLVVMRDIPPGRRLPVFLFHPQVTRKSFWLAISLGFVLTILGELLNGLVLRPIARNWLSPRVDHSEAQFRLSASESIVDAIPARRRRGPWSWEPGSLVRTNIHVWFFPTAWESEPSSMRVSDLDRFALTPAPALLGGLIRDLPDRLVWTSPIGEGAVFAVSNPQSLQHWLPVANEDAAPDAA